MSDHWVKFSNYDIIFIFIYVLPILFPLIFVLSSSFLINKSKDSLTLQKISPLIIFSFSTIFSNNFFFLHSLEAMIAVERANRARIFDCTTPNNFSFTDLNKKKKKFFLWFYFILLCYLLFVFFFSLISFPLSICMVEWALWNSIAFFLSLYFILSIKQREIKEHMSNSNYTKEFVYLLLIIYIFFHWFSINLLIKLNKICLTFNISMLSFTLKFVLKKDYTRQHLLFFFGREDCRSKLLKKKDKKGI